MRKFIIILFLPMFALSQMVVPTVSVEGFESAVMSSNQSLDLDGYSINEIFLKQELLIKRFLFDELTNVQSFYEENRTASDFTDWLIGQGFDQKVILKKGNLNYFDILVVRQKADEVLMIIDHNRDKLFSEKPITYKNDLDSKISDFHLLPKIIIDLELYDKKGNTKSVKHPVSLNPHKNSYFFQKPIDNKIPFSILSNNYKSCTIDYKGALYHFKLFNNSISPYYLHSNTEFIAQKEDSTGLSTEIRRYKIGDFIWGTNLRLSSISAFGDSLFVEESNNISRFGVNENEYVSNDIAEFLDKKDKYLILNFWGTWCKPCLEEMPTFASVYEQLDLSKGSFVSISTQSTEEKITSFFEKNGIKWLNLRNEDLTSDIVGKMRIDIFPTTILLSPENQIIKKYQRVIDETEYLSMLRNNHLLKK